MLYRMLWRDGVFLPRLYGSAGGFQGNVCFPNTHPARISFATLCLQTSQFLADKPELKAQYQKEIAEGNYA